MSSSPNPTRPRQTSFWDDWEKAKQLGLDYIQGVKEGRWATPGQVSTDSGYDPINERMQSSADVLKAVTPTFGTDWDVQGAKEDIKEGRIVDAAGKFGWGTVGAALDFIDPGAGHVATSLAAAALPAAARVGAEAGGHVVPKVVKDLVADERGGLNIVSPTGKPLTKKAQREIEVAERREAQRSAEATATAGPELSESRVAQRVPTFAGADPNIGSTRDLRIDTDVMRQDPEYWDKVTNAQLTVDKDGNPVMTTVKGQPGPQARGPLTDIIPEKVATSKDPEERAIAATRIMMSNLQRQYDMMDPAVRSAATKWYPGGSKMIDDMAARTGITREAAAANVAALSPQKDWYQNFSMADRIADTRAADPLISREMVRSLAENGSEEYRGMAKRLEPYIGSRWSQIEKADDAGLAAVAHDVHTRGGDYPVLSPTGKFMHIAKKGDESPAKLAWTNLGNVAKAVQAVRSEGDLGLISNLLGGAHKVRNFYNNLIAPRGPWNDFTNDTHNIAAALLRPLSGNDTLVQVGLGNAGPKTALTGSKGTYGMFADAGRQLSEHYGVLPFEIQSPTWEGVRALFPASAKAGAKKAVNDIWADYRKGDLTLTQAQDAVFRYARDKIKGSDINRVPWREQ